MVPRLSKLSAFVMNLACAATAPSQSKLEPSVRRWNFEVGRVVSPPGRFGLWRFYQQSRKRDIVDGEEKLRGFLGGKVVDETERLAAAIDDGGNVRLGEL